MHNYFCGWYFKCQSHSQTLALIPAFHKSGKDRSCSIQLITDSGSWNIPFPDSDFRKSRSCITIAGSRFGKDGIHLELQSPGLTAAGSLTFGPFTPICYDIMGPFALVPFMECRHSVLSMKHTVNGELSINGVPYTFHNAVGYLEGDRGRSFPSEYAWTQCSFPEGALMLSAAEIPIGRVRFTGVIGVIHWQGREYRLATYLGARAVKIKAGEMVIRQGSMRLMIKQLEKAAHPLQAPDNGVMCRTIHEQASCRIFYEFQRDGRILFSFVAPNAAMEYEFPY